MPAMRFLSGRTPRERIRRRKEYDVAGELQVGSAPASANLAHIPSPRSSQVLVDTGALCKGKTTISYLDNQRKRLCADLTHEL